VWRLIGVLVRVAVWRLVALLVLVVAVLAAFLLLWEYLELEAGAALGVGELRVRADEELADAVVSYALL
jgi:hypothetical protein